MNKMKRGFTLVELLVVIGILGILMGVLIPKIAGAMSSTKINTCKIQGGNLYKAIVAAGLDHPEKDPWALWPRTDATKGDDDTEITGQTFGTAYEYFKALFDIDHYGSQDWKSYLNGKADLSVLSGSGVPAAKGKDFKNRNLMWCVAQGVSDTIPDVVPVLVTRNAAVDNLFVSGTFQGTENTELGIGKEKGGESNTPFGKDVFVLVRRSGAADSVEARYSKLYTIYEKQSFTIESAQDFKYLKTGASD